MKVSVRAAATVIALAICVVPGVAAARTSPPKSAPIAAGAPGAFPRVLGFWRFYARMQPRRVYRIFSARGIKNPPLNTSLPAITGNALVGATLAASPGTWSATTAPSYAYEWRRCDAQGGSCSKIPGARGSTYALAGRDVGATLVVAVTATTAAGSATAVSVRTAVVAWPPPANTGLPAISGTLSPGNVLSASTGTWSSSTALAYAYAWSRCDASGNACAPIFGATAQTYQVSATDAGTTLRATVTASNAGGTATATSAAAAIAASAPAPSPPPPPPPTSTSSRWFSSASPVNTPIPADAAVDANSPAMVNALVADANAQKWTVAVKYYSVPVYYANANTPKYNVSLTASWRPASTMFNVPIPDNAKPDAGSDGHMAVIDQSDGCFYEFYAAQKTPSGWTSNWANRGLMSGTGIQPGSYSTRDSGFANVAGLIRPEELQAGVIDHALAFATTYTQPSTVVLPATGGSGSGSPPAGAMDLPEGAHVQLDPSLNLDSLNLTPWQKTVARALQVYGMYLTDTGGLSLYTVNPQSYSTNPYIPFWGDSSYAYLPTSLTSHLRVLKLGTQYDPRASAYLATSPCADMK